MSRRGDRSRVQVPLIVMLTLAVGLGWTETAVAQLRAPHVKAKPTLTQRGYIPQRILADKSDLVCSIVATKDYGGTQPETDYTVHDGENVWFHVTVENKGPAEAKDFVTRVIVGFKSNSSKMYDQSHKLTSLPAGLMKKFAPVKITVPGRSLGFWILAGTVDADEFYAVPETSKSNNRCSVELQVKW